MRIQSSSQQEHCPNVFFALFQNILGQELTNTISLNVAAIFQRVVGMTVRSSALEKRSGTPQYFIVRTLFSTHDPPTVEIRISSDRSPLLEDPVQYCGLGTASEPLVSSKETSPSRYTCGNESRESCKSTDLDEPLVSGGWKISQVYPLPKPANRWGCWSADEVFALRYAKLDADWDRSGGQGRVWPCFRRINGKVDCSTVIAVKESSRAVKAADFKELTNVIKLLIAAPASTASCLMRFNSVIRVPLDDKRIQIESEYCDGGDLEQMKVRCMNDGLHKVPETIIWAVYRDMAKALAYLHDGYGCRLQPPAWVTICHNDIKPANVMVTRNRADLDGMPLFKLIDFDLARFYRPEKRRRDTAGTYAFQPPEQWADPVNPRATPGGDVWALGATIHYLATEALTPGDFSCDRFDDELCPGDAHCAGKHAYGCEGEEGDVGTTGGVLLEEESRTPEHEDELIWQRTRPRTVRRIDKAHKLVRSRSTEQRRSEPYTSILNDWMLQALILAPERRTTARRLLKEMVPVAESIIQAYPFRNDRPLPGHINAKFRIFQYTEYAPWMGGCRWTGDHWTG